MATSATTLPTTQSTRFQVKSPHLIKLAEFPNLRVLCWDKRQLYASRGYSLLKLEVCPEGVDFGWRNAGAYRPVIRNRLTGSTRLTSRLFRDGFHALAILSSGHIVGAVPGRILTLAPGETEFRVTHNIVRGTRPLHITAAPNNHVVWGEYFDNPQRNEVYIYGSTDQGNHWDVAYAFPKRQIRHVHNIIYDQWGNCYWILTGDADRECRILRAGLDFAQVETVYSGTQQTRAAALIPDRDGVYWASDTPSEANHIHRLDRKGILTTVADIPGSSIYGCRVGDALFFSTMVEPSQVNRERKVSLLGSSDGQSWEPLMQWKKDIWPMKLFQYGNAFLPDGANQTDVLALSTFAVKDAHLTTALFHVAPR
jgi:hypothetical protein